MAILEAIFLFLGEAFRWAKAHWRFALTILGLVLVIGFAFYLKGCIEDYKQQKVTNDLTNSNSQIFQANTNSGIIENEVNKRENEVKDAEKQTKPALENVNRARANDSSTESDDERAARERFCKSYPSDSRCVKR